MNKEIKEALDLLNDFANNENSWYVNDYQGYAYDKINPVINKLLEYITHLQNQLEEKTYLYNKLDIESKYTITDLQQENERLKRKNAINAKNAKFKMINENMVEIEMTINQVIEELINDNKSLEKAILDYKSRVEKAIEYINETKLIDYENDDIDMLKDTYVGFDLLNILQGSDKE